MAEIRRWRGIRAIVLNLPLLAIALVFWRASHAKEEAAIEVLSRSQISFRVAPLDRVVPSAVEPIASDSQVSAISPLIRIWLPSARAPAFFYTRTGVLERSYRVGLELPLRRTGRYVHRRGRRFRRSRSCSSRRAAKGCSRSMARAFRQILPAALDLRNVTAVLVLGSRPRPAAAPNLTE